MGGVVTGPGVFDHGDRRNPCFGRRRFYRSLWNVLQIQNKVPNLLTNQYAADGVTTIKDNVKVQQWQLICPHANYPLVSLAYPLNILGRYWDYTSQTILIPQPQGETGQLSSPKASRSFDYLSKVPT
jgi:hypothetical protein